MATTLCDTVLQAGFTQTDNHAMHSRRKPLEISLDSIQDEVFTSAVMSRQVVMNENLHGKNLSSNVLVTNSE